MADRRKKERGETDELTAALTTVTEFLSKYRTAVIVGAAAVVVGAIVAAAVANSRAKTRLAMEAEMAEALFMMQVMQFDQAALLLESTLERYPRGPLSDDALYHCANAEFLSRNIGRAKDLFQQFIDAAPKDPYRRFTASEGIAQCWEHEGEFGRAATLYEELVSQSPENKRVPAILAQAARSYERAGEWESVERLGRQLMEEHGESGQWQREGARLVARAKILGGGG